MKLSKIITNEDKIIDDIVNEIISDRHYMSSRLFKLRMAHISKNDINYYFENNKHLPFQSLDIKQSKVAMIEDVVIHLSSK